MVHEINFSVRDYSTRQNLRQIVISKFMKEAPGLGKGDKTSRYRYNVETLTEGNRIYLTRPAWKKKGFDFLIHVEGVVFQNGRDNPAHKDILNDLKEKRRHNPKAALKLHAIIKKVYECEDPDDILPKFSHTVFKSGYPVELVSKVIKWFFIEQDIRDWNFSGRRMFMDGVDKVLL